MYIVVGCTSDDIDLAYTAAGCVRPISQLVYSVHSCWVNNHSIFLKAFCSVFVPFTLEIVVPYLRDLGCYFW